MTTRTQQVSAVFEHTHSAFMPYLTIGFPNLEASIAAVEACAANGADLIELGVPFSDPLADGPTIQYSTQIALQEGVTVAKCMAAVKQLRERGVSLPLLMMGYYNPIMAYGVERYVEDASKAGANGFIIPDLPPEEAEPIQRSCQQYDLALIFMLSPNSPVERIKLVSCQSSAFIYLVSVMGITGERNELPEDLKDFIDRVKAQTDKPVAVGFGISTPKQAQAVAAMADGVIVGSAMVKAASADKKQPQTLIEFVRQMAEAVHHSSAEG